MCSLKKLAICPIAELKRFIRLRLDEHKVYTLAEYEPQPPVFRWLRTNFYRICPFSQMERVAEAT